MMSSSKPLGRSDTSGAEFAKEMLAGNPTAAVNLDRIQKRKADGRYIIFEYLLCEQTQTVTPYSSHPNRYWNKNKHKFISLYEIKCKMDATLFLVNYAKKGTPHQDEVLLMRVDDCNRAGIKTTNWQLTRQTFSQWFIKLNEQCL